MRHSCLTHSYTAASMAGASCFTCHTSLIINPFLLVDKDKGNCRALSGKKKKKESLFLSLLRGCERWFLLCVVVISSKTPSSYPGQRIMNEGIWMSFLLEGSSTCCWSMFQALNVWPPLLAKPCCQARASILDDCGKTLEIYSPMATMLWLKVQHKKFSLEKTFPSVCYTCSCACKRSWELKRSKCASTGAPE